MERVEPDKWPKIPIRIFREESKELIGTNVQRNVSAQLIR